MIKQFRTKTEQELNDLIRGWKSELLALRFQQAVGQLEKPHKFKELRVSVARALTVLAERKAAVDKGGAPLTAKDLKKSSKELKKSVKAKATKTKRGKAAGPMKPKKTKAPKETAKQDKGGER